MRSAGTRSLRLLALLALLVSLGALPVPAVAEAGPGAATACYGGSPADLPPDSDHVTWEYTPPTGAGDARLMCAGDMLATIIEQSPATWGLAVRDLRSRETLLVNPDEHFVAGSLYKLGVAAEAYARIAAGALTEESVVLVSDQDVDPEYGGSRYAAGTYLSVQQAMQAMITESDNGAALALVDRLGLNAVNLRFSLLGMPDTRLLYDATTTPRDMLTYFTRLADEDVVSPDASDSLVRLLTAQEINDRIPAGLPSDGGWRVAHKTANVDDMLGDAGIVYAPTNDAFALVILAQGPASYDDAIQAMRSIAQVAYRTLEL